MTIAFIVAATLVVLLFATVTIWSNRLRAIHRWDETGHCITCGQPWPCGTLLAIGVTRSAPVRKL